MSEQLTRFSLWLAFVFVFSLLFVVALGDLAFAAAWFAWLRSE